MDISDDDELIVRFRRDDATAVEQDDGEDSTNYMALHYEERMAKKDTSKRSERTTSKPRAPKLKLTSNLLMAPHGLTLLARQCRQTKIQPKEGSEGIQLTRILQMYDAWAKQLCPGLDLDRLYSKLEKIGAERAVKEQTELLIAGRNVDDLDALQTHTMQMESLIERHNLDVKNKMMESEEGEEVELEIDETTSANTKQPAPGAQSTSSVRFGENVEIDLPEGDFGAPEGFDDDFN